jgi:hypothetical protein
MVKFPMQTSHYSSCTSITFLNPKLRNPRALYCLRLVPQSHLHFAISHFLIIIFGYSFSSPQSNCCLLHTSTLQHPLSRLLVGAHQCLTRWRERSMLPRWKQGGAPVCMTRRPPARWDRGRASRSPTTALDCRPRSPRSRSRSPSSSRSGWSSLVSSPLLLPRIL